jgi:hypothetical protein
MKVNGQIAVSSYDFVTTEKLSYWKYNQPVYVSLESGENLIRLTVVEQNDGPRIDHLLVGKPDAVVIKLNGHVRAVARNGLGFWNDWGFEFTNETSLVIPSIIDPPQGDIFKYLQGRVRLATPSGWKWLDCGNVSNLGHCLF